MHTPQSSSQWKNNPDSWALTGHPSILKQTMPINKKQFEICREGRPKSDCFKAQSLSKPKKVEFRPELNKVEFNRRLPLSNIKLDTNTRENLETRLQVYFKKKKEASASSDLRIGRLSNPKIGSVRLRLNLNSVLQASSVPKKDPKTFTSNQASRFSVDNRHQKQSDDTNKERNSLPKKELDNLTKEFKASEYGLSTIEVESDPNTFNLCSQIYCGEGESQNPRQIIAKDPLAFPSNCLPVSSSVESTIYKHLYDKLVSEYSELKQRCDKQELELSKIKRSIHQNQTSEASINVDLDESELEKIAKFENTKLNDQRLLSGIHQSTSLFPSRPQSLQSSHYRQQLPTANTNSDRISRLDIENILSARIIRPVTSRQTERSNRVEKSHFEKFSMRLTDVKKVQTQPTNRQIRPSDLTSKQKVVPLLMHYTRPSESEKPRESKPVVDAKRFQALGKPYNWV